MKDFLILFWFFFNTLVGIPTVAAGAMVDAGVASIAQEIGRAYRNGAGDMSWLTHKVCHFVLGGGSAALRGEDPLAGAIGATIGEVVADAMIQRALERTRADVLEQLEDFRNTYGTLPPIQDAELLTQITFQERLLYERERIEQVGRLAAAGTAFVGRMDVSTADAAALNALEHNAIPSIDVLIENQHRSLLDQLLAYEQASIEQGVVESQADREAAVFFEPAITFLCPPLELAALGIRHYALGEVIPASELAIAGLNILPIGKGCAIVSKGATKVVARVSTKIRPSAWNKTTKFEGVLVHQRDSFIDPLLRDTNGLTNIQRMKKGKAPIGPDGEALHLHHVLQEEGQPLVELTRSMHEKYYSNIHIFSKDKSFRSGIDRSNFSSFRSRYWKDRAKYFE